MSHIDVRNVTKRYGDVVALDEVSLSIKSGESLGLVGTNGAGKTTLFRLLVGHEKPDAGTVRVGDIDPTAGITVRQQVGYLPEDVGFEPVLTGREVITFHARMRGVPESVRERRIAAVLGVVGLSGDADRPVETYSNGMVQRLGLATVLVDDPDVLLLDEPTAGLDLEGVAAFNEAIERVCEARDVTVVLSSHVLSEVEQLCDRVAVLADSQLRTCGTISDLAANTDATVTVRAELDNIEPVATHLRNKVERASVEIDDGRLVVTCPQSAETAVLAELVDHKPRSIAVDQPGLADSVRDLLSLDGGEPA